MLLANLTADFGVQINHAVSRRSDFMDSFKSSQKSQMHLFIEVKGLVHPNENVGKQTVDGSH